MHNGHFWGEAGGFGGEASPPPHGRQNPGSARVENKCYNNGTVEVDAPKEVPPAKKS